MIHLFSCHIIYYVQTRAWCRLYHSYKHDWRATIFCCDCEFRI